MTPVETKRSPEQDQEDEEDIRRMNAQGIDWKWGGDGRPVAIDYPNRAARRAARFKHPEKWDR